MATQPQLSTLELPIRGMCCADEAQDVERAIARLRGVHSVTVLLAAERATVRYDPSQVGLAAIEGAVAEGGCSVASPADATHPAATGGFGRVVLALFGAVLAVALLVVVLGEWFGLLDAVTDWVPWPAWAALLLASGYPVFRNVLRATLRRTVTAHTLMTLGVIAAALVGEWPAALVVVMFMRIAEYVESFTTDRARRALRDLTAMAPETARVERDELEVELPVEEVGAGEIVIVRPGEKVPVDGEVVAGAATVDQAAITGESMPIEAGPGTRVFAASLVRLGMLRVRATRVGADTTFGRVIRLVEEAEGNRADVQRLADRFATLYLPVVVTIALLTFAIGRDPQATAAVLVVACSCAFAIATPVAVLASVGAAARQGLLIKGGRYLEALARADVVFLDKTGTLTFGRPQLVEVVSLNGASSNEVLALAASAEKYSEHPLAAAVRNAANARGLSIVEPERFESMPGIGVRAVVDGALVTVGRRTGMDGAAEGEVARLEAQGHTLLFVRREDDLVGALAAADTLRAEVPEAIAELRAVGLRHIELLTGDNERTAAALAEPLGIPYRAGLLPEEKIAIVREYQAKGHTVVMVGDGVNDAPALAQADVGIAMGAAGTDIAIEAAHIALMRDDWRLIPEVFDIARRTMRVVRLNIGFTVVYNLIGLTLASMGLLPLVLAAAAQSLPDVGILANSSRLLRGRRGMTSPVSPRAV